MREQLKTVRDRHKAEAECAQTGQENGRPSMACKRPEHVPASGQCIGCEATQGEQAQCNHACIAGCARLAEVHRQ